MTNDMAILMALTEFTRILEEEGEDAAIEWAEMMELSLTAPEESDSEPHLRIVG